MTITGSRRSSHALIAVWTAAIVLFIYLPSFCGIMASLTAGRYFIFPIQKWGLGWWGKTLASIEVRSLLTTRVKTPTL